ncbi:T9SS type A sorting domain-containing protein [Saprospiraceae bacterium]|nr:T9SS type A sorting domain-containing protein [Saprospiraceae bacterium]
MVIPGNSTGTHTDDIVIAGTYEDGVIFFSQGGDVEESIVNGSGFVRSLAAHPAVPNVVYAAIQFANTALNGIYEIDYTNLSNPTSTLAYQTLRPEGLTMLSSGNVYAAISEEGLVKQNGSNGNWNLVNSGLSINDPNRQWTAVTGYRKGNQDIVYAGTNNIGGNANGSNYSNIWRSVNGGSTWTPLVDASVNVSDQILGQTYDWWFRTDAFQQAGLGRTNSIVSSIEVSQGNNANFVSDDIIYVSGRGGIWKSDDGGTNWNPAVYNMQVTANRGVAVNDNNPSQIAIANTDFVVLESNNRFVGDAISRDKPNGAESRGYDIIFDMTADEVIVGVGDRDTNNPGGGEVYKKASANLGAPSNSGWTNLGLSSATASNNGRARAISYGYHNGTSSVSQTILAAVEGEGFYRYINGNWSQSTGVNIGQTKRSKFIWPDNTNSGVVYLLDLSAGLFRSNNGGQTWTDIWPSMSFNNNDFFNTGYITADDNDLTTLYLSIQGGSGSPIGTGFRIYRMTGADTGIFGPPGSAGITDISFHSGNASINRPGPIVLGADSRLWLTQQQNSANNHNAALFVMNNPTSDTNFTDMTTNAYRDIAIQPSGIDVSADGYVYIAQGGTGIVKVNYIDGGSTGLPNMELSIDCIEILPDPDSNIYTVNGLLSGFDIEILDVNGNLHTTVDNTGSSVSIDTSNLPSGLFFIRVSKPGNNQLVVEKILKM